MERDLCLETKTAAGRRRRSAADGVHHVFDRCLCRVAHAGEIATHQLERVSFFIDFPLSPHAEPAEEVYRRTPTLDGVLKQECRHRGRQKIPATAYQAPEREADE